MRINLFIILTALLLSSASCNRKVQAAILHTTLHQDSTNAAIDTTKKTFNQTIKETTAFGDTLTTKIIVPFDVKVDTSFKKKTPVKPFPIFVESNGITILGSLTQKEDGSGFDLDLKAIAKPKSTTKETTTTASENKGVATNNTNKKDIDQSTKQKGTETVNELYKWIGLTLLGLGILLLIAVIIYLKLKENSNGN